MIKKIYARNSISQLLRLQNGFSLVELMVAIALGVFLVLGVTNILFSGQQSFNATNRIARIQENGQLAKNMIINDLKRARFMGVNTTLNDDNSGPLGSLQNAVAVAPTCDNTWGQMIEQGLFGLDDNDIDTNGATYACITNIGNGTVGSRIRGDILTVRYASPQEIANVNVFALNPTRLYIRNSLSPSASWIFTGQNEDISTRALHPIMSDHELMAFSYYIGDSNRPNCAGNGNIPSLFRIRLDATGQPMREELFPGMEDFQVQFSVDGTTYQDADAVTDWSTVRATQIWLLARSECQEGGHNDNRTYTLAGIDYTPNNGNGDGYRRQLYTSVINHRN